MQIDFEQYKQRENVSQDKNNNQQNTEVQMDDINTNKIRDSQKNVNDLAINKPEDNPQKTIKVILPRIRIISPKIIGRKATSMICRKI